jgi:hypothetical protein
MDESHKWGRSRYIAILIVSAIHLSVVTALIIAAKSLHLGAPVPQAIDLLVLPTNTAARKPEPLPATENRSIRAMSVPLQPSSAITVDQSAVAADRADAPGIDWAQEARNVAAGLAKEASPGRNDEPAASLPSPFALPPPHHKGEQIPTADGRWIVFVSDDCYQVSKDITAITNATNTGIALQTYCTRRSKTPRGDLFDQLPAYKKYHPDN